MARDLAISNGRLLVMFDREYRIRDIYFPHVGKENHGTGHEFRFGVWVGGQFSWMGKEWAPEMRYADSSMVTEVRARNAKLGVELLCNDGVDFYENAMIRRVRVTNLADRPREIRCFFHHDFRIRGNEVGDTAFYSPEAEAILHYKEDRYFLMNCQVNHTVGVHHYACGTKDVAGAEGTWRDAEDGMLQGNPVAQGSVDSTLGVSLMVPAHETGEFFYWMAAARDFREVTTIDSVVRDKSPGELLRRTGNYWRLWVGKDRRGTADLPERVIDRYKQSLLIINSQIDHGAASWPPTTPTSACWPATRIPMCGPATVRWYPARSCTPATPVRRSAFSPSVPASSLPTAICATSTTPMGAWPRPGTDTSTTASRCSPSRRTRPRW